MAKPNPVAKTSRHTHLKYTVDKKDIELPHETSICGRKVSSEVLESEDEFIVKVTTKFPFEKDDVKTLKFAKGAFKLKKTIW